MNLTQELCSLAAGREGRALQYVGENEKTEELCKMATRLSLLMSVC